MKVSGKSPRPWVKLWKEEVGAFAQLPFLTRAIASELLKFLDDDGRLFVGEKNPADALAFVAGATRGDRRVMRTAIEQLIEIGHLRMHDGWLEAARYGFRQYGEEADTSAPLTTAEPASSLNATTTEQRTDHDRDTTEQRPCDDGATTASRPCNESEPKYAESREPAGQEKRRGEEIREEREEDPRAAADAARAVLARRIEDLSKPYPPELLRDVYDGCRLSRRAGKMADGRWADTLDRLAQYPAHAVIAAMQTFVDRYGAGDKDERYLLGIVRGEVAQQQKLVSIGRRGGFQAPADHSKFQDTDLDALFATEAAQ